MIQLLWALTMVILVAACSSVPTSFKPDRPILPQDFSHAAFDEVLRSHVTEGVVNYPDIAGDPRFASYLDDLNRVDPGQLATRSDRLAFWINAYNALAIQGILDGYSPTTLVGQYRYFIGNDHPIGGARIDLYDLERKILIPQFREPRIHFAIVCASRSCPKLRSEAYAADKLEEQLEQAALDFINDPSRNRFDRENHVAYLSKIFDWFEDDFVADSGSLLHYVKRYVQDEELVRELEGSTYRVEFLRYDWRLNGIPTRLTLHHGRLP